MRTIIRAGGILTPSCSKSSVTYAFELFKCVEKLCIDFSYTPKIMQSQSLASEIMKRTVIEFLPKEEIEGFLAEEKNLCNMLTISLDYESDFRGSAHRHPCKQHVEISKTSATPGFLAGLLPEGRWLLTVSAHSVITDVCEYELHIYEDE
jgi:hypothetical protein